MIVLRAEQELRQTEAKVAARERLRQEEAERAETLLRTALDSMESGLVMTSPKHKIELVNDKIF